MRVDVGGVGIEYEVSGEGRPVVLIHGFPDSGRLWRHQVPALVEAGYRTIVPDLRGYGGPRKPPGGGAEGASPRGRPTCLRSWATPASTAPTWSGTTGARLWRGGSVRWRAIASTTS